MTTIEIAHGFDETDLLQDRGGLMVTDLLMTGATIEGHLRTTLAREQWLDAYLFSCALGQLLDDLVHPDPWGLRRASDYLRSRPNPMSAPMAAGVGALATVAGLPSHDLARRWLEGRRLIGELQLRLANLVLAPARGLKLRAELMELADQAISAIGALGHDRSRLPSSFRDFDQHPDDLRWLAAAYVTERRPGNRPVAVVGVRTSGSYLAPLLASALQHRGVEVVAVLTMRPGRPFRSSERRALAGLGRVPGEVLVVDDPPGTGSALATACSAIVRTGVPASSVTAAFARFGGDRPLAALRRTRTVVQPWSSWTIHDRLAAPALERALGGLLDAQVSVIGGPEALATGQRGHLAVRFAAEVSSPASRLTSRREFVAEGVGIGFLGRHALAVGAALAHHVPRMYGIVDGVLFREWLTAGSGDVDADAICEYVVDRARTLPARIDPTPALRGRDPVWETAAATLAGPFGPGGPVARTLMIEPVVRRLLRVGSPTIVDGDTRPGRWVGTPDARRKIAFHQRAFCHFDHNCYDHVFDLAGAAAAPGASALGIRLRASYRNRTGGSIDPERWLLYRLAQLRRAVKAGDLDTEQARYASAETVYDFLAECFPEPDVAPAGPLCAIDLDGVLETDRLGYPATSPLGVLAIRALQAHGFRPVIATGRSLAEAVSRSQALGLPAAIAEYGAAVWVDSRELDLRTDAEAAAIDEARSRLTAYSDVSLADYRHVVRASCSGRPLPRHLEQILADLEVRTIRGAEQTDVVPLRVSKGRGLDAVSAALESAPWALAVGDSAEDLSMFERAEIALGPGNASDALRRSAVETTPARYQAGLAAVVGRLLGHQPGRCPACRPPRLSARSRPLLALLALSEAGDAGFAPRLLRAAAETIRFCSGRAR